jgi:hypothetical protein
MEWVVSNMLGRAFKEQAHKSSGRAKGRDVLEIKNAKILERGIATSKLYAVEFLISWTSSWIIWISCCWNQNKATAVPVPSHATLFIDFHWV